DAAHDLAASRLRQAGGELHNIGRGDGANFLAYPLDQFAAQVVAVVHAVHRGDIGIDALALDVVRHAHDGCLGHQRVFDQRAFHFGGAHAVAGHVDHIVDPPGDPVIAVPVTPAAVAGEVLAGVLGEIGLDEAVMV